MARPNEKSRFPLRFSNEEEKRLAVEFAKFKGFTSLNGYLLGLWRTDQRNHAHLQPRATDASGEPADTRESRGTQ